MTTVVRTRFAPSPTGYLHIGGARTALFNWLYAKKNGGEFILRIEDTDTDRNVVGSDEAIFNGLDWLALDYANKHGVWFQSERQSLYMEMVQQMISSGHAFVCECDEVKEKPVGYQYPKTCLHAKHEYKLGRVVRLNTDKIDQSTGYTDLVFGERKFKLQALYPVIVRADGMAVYNLSAAVDDALSEVSHVIRGDDHLLNTNYQIPIIQALGLPVPQYAHVPMIMANKKEKLSKRHGAVSVQEFENKGHHPTALLSFLFRLGFRTGTDEELFSLVQMIEMFSLERISRSPAIFDPVKCDKLNVKWKKKFLT